MSHTANHNLFNLDDGLRVQLRNLLQEREVLREEIRQLRASVQIYAEQHGTHDPSYAISLRNFARLLLDMKRTSDARARCEEAHAVLNEKLGEDHPDTLKCKQLLQAIPSEPALVDPCYAI